MGYIKAEYSGNELDFSGYKCNIVEYMAFACGVADGVLGAIVEKEHDKELFEDMKTAIIEEIKAMEMKDYESNI